MKGISLFSHFILYVFLIMFLWVGTTYVSQNIHYSSAERFHGNVVKMLENSYFSVDVVEQCKADAEKNGYVLGIEMFENQDNKDARVTLEVTYRFPIVQREKTYRIEGYAR